MPTTARACTGPPPGRAVPAARTRRSPAAARDARRAHPRGLVICRRPRRQQGRSSEHRQALSRGESPVINSNEIQAATIVVVGGGYAGLFAAHRARRAAARARRTDVRIIVVDAEDDWQERNRWHQVAAGETILSRSRRRIFRGTGVETVSGTVA